MGILIVFFPFIPLCIVAYWFTGLMKLEEQKIAIPLTVSPFNTIKQNSEIITNYLMSDSHVDSAIIKSVCKTVKNCQLSMLFYLIVGPLQFFSIFIYSFSLLNDFENIRMLYENNPNQLAAYIVFPLMAFVTFWIFYGSNFFTYVGLEKSEKIISKAIHNLLDLSRKIEKKILSFALSFIYFALLLIYLSTLIPLANNFGESYALRLLWVCSLVFFFYYLMPTLFAYIYSKFKIKSFDLLSRNYIYENLKNTTYLHLLFLFFYGVLLQNSSGILLQAITILFLYDTYRAKKIDIKKLLKDKKPDDIS